MLDGIGGDSCYGQIDTVDGASGTPARWRSPSTRASSRSVARDDPVPLDAVEVDDTAPIVRLRTQQDAALGATV